MLIDEAQFIHCKVKGKTDDFEAYVTIVYGYNTMEQRKTLWQGIEKVAQGINGEWILWGDYNAILSQNDRLMGNPVTQADIQDFSQCINNLQLNELAWRGEYYTWSNKQVGTDRIWSRIDRAFGNTSWMMKWGHVQTEYDLPYISDHAPVFLQLAETPKGGPLPFIFFNIWTEHPKFLGMVEDIWWRQVNTNEYKTVRNNIDQARLELKRIQIQIALQCSEGLVRQERVVLQSLEKWSLIKKEYSKGRNPESLG
ncbi:hypothetical protein KY285_015936 [Solanum tuberosum]|nr:hypothetical protein KY285_015936 [Solanum tuberosum]